MWLYWKQMCPGMSTLWKSWLCLYLYSNGGPDSQESTQPNWKEKKKKNTFWKIVGLTHWEQPSTLSSSLRLHVDLRVVWGGFVLIQSKVFFMFCYIRPCFTHQSMKQEEFTVMFSAVAVLRLEPDKCNPIWCLSALQIINILQVSFIPCLLGLGLDK